MTSQWDNDNPNDSTDQDQTKGLRGHVKKLETELQTLRQERDAAVTQARQAVVSTTLSAKGVNPKIAKLIPPDVSTPEAIDTWLAEYGDVFGATKDDSKDDSGSKVDPETQAQLDQMRQLTALQQNAMVPAKYDDIMGQLTDRELTQEKLLELIAQHGGGIGQG